MFGGRQVRTSNIIPARNLIFRQEDSDFPANATAFPRFYAKEPFQLLSAIGYENSGTWTVQVRINGSSVITVNDTDATPVVASAGAYVTAGSYVDVYVIAQSTPVNFQLTVSIQ